MAKLYFSNYMKNLFICDYLLNRQKIIQFKNGNIVYTCIFRAKYHWLFSFSDYNQMKKITSKLEKQRKQKKFFFITYNRINRNWIVTQDMSMNKTMSYDFKIHIYI